MFLLGYMPNLNRVFLVDKMFNVVSYELLSSVLDFQNAVVRSDIELAESLVKNIPESSRNKVARFVESLGHPALALNISRDNDYKCDLAMQLGKLDLAKELVLASPSENKWRHLGDLALKKGQIALADSCMLQAGDVNSLLLLRSSLGDAKGIKELSVMAQGKGRLNVAFVCEYILGNADNCIAILHKFSRHPEAAMLARSYKPRYRL
jgi:coatomer subunit beta'